MRQKKYIYSVIASLVGQWITVGCGMVLPAVLIQNYGSEIYGTTNSITQFLGYIALMEGGIGGVARTALYKPLAERDEISVSRLVTYIQRFFRIIAGVFMIYTLVVACCYKFIARGNSFDWFFTFALVIVISLSSLAQYYFGVTYNILLQADQKTYVTTTLTFTTTLFNTMVACILATNHVNIILLKLAWCGGHVLRIAILIYYIRRHYILTPCKPDKNAMPQKWDGLGQHIAYFLHSNTDIVVLTILVGVKEVAVYSVYNYIATSLNAIVMVCTGNMEAVFGDMLAKKELRNLNQFVDIIEFILSTLVIICFSTAISMILPFIKIYTAGVTDVEYQRPGFAVILLLAQMFYCLRQPYHSLTIAAGHFRQTAWAAYMEAGLNIILSVIFCIRFGMVGVVLATLISIVFRMTYYVFYLHENIICRPIWKTVKRINVTLICMALSVMVNRGITELFSVPSNYFQWAFIAVCCALVSGTIVLVFSSIFYWKELIGVCQRVAGVFRKHKLG